MKIAQSPPLKQLTNHQDRNYTQRTGVFENTTEFRTYNPSLRSIMAESWMATVVNHLSSLFAFLIPQQSRPDLQCLPRLLWRQVCEAIFRLTSLRSKKKNGKNFTVNISTEIYSFIIRVHYHKVPFNIASILSTCNDRIMQQVDELIYCLPYTAPMSHRAPSSVLKALQCCMGNLVIGMGLY